MAVIVGSPSRAKALELSAAFPQNFRVSGLTVNKPTPLHPPREPPTATWALWTSNCIFHFLRPKIPASPLISSCATRLTRRRPWARLAQTPILASHHARCRYSPSPVGSRYLARPSSSLNNSRPPRRAPYSAPPSSSRSNSKAPYSAPSNNHNNSKAPYLARQPAKDNSNSSSNSNSNSSRPHNYPPLRNPRRNSPARYGSP